MSLIGQTWDSGMGVPGIGGAVVVVIEASVVVAYVIAWAVRKARRVAGRVDKEVDAAVDAGLDRLHEVVAEKLGRHPALDDLDEEAATEDGKVSELTRQQVELAILAAARKDEAFAQAVTEQVARVRAAEQAAGQSVTAGAIVFYGDAHAHASDGGIAFGQAGIVNLDRSQGPGRSDPSGPGRSSH
jgi:hypothetical protein